MSIIGSLIVGAVIATTPATPLPWFTLDDYPTKAFKEEWQGVTNFSVIVAPDGRAVDCTITKSSRWLAAKWVMTWNRLTCAPASPSGARMGM